MKPQEYGSRVDCSHVLFRDYDAFDRHKRMKVWKPKIEKVIAELREEETRKKQ